MILIALALTQASPALDKVDPDAWRVVSEGSSNAKFMMKNKDIWNEANYNPTVWVKVDQSANPTVKERYSMFRYTFDCRAETIKLIAWVDYDAKGISLGSSPDYMASPAKPAVPDSTGETMMKNACPSK